MSRAVPRPAARLDTISYEESKRLARNENPAVRARVAAREDVRPEVLYYLAEDSSAEVRRHIAANQRTPGQADLLLARDADESVRRLLADKIARLLPELDSEEKSRAQSFVFEALEVLVQDQAVRVRQILADTLKELPTAPAEVMQRLARDAEDVVACPVLEFSPLLSDRDLLEIIEAGCATGKLCAISRRRTVAEQVADAIVATEDAGAITELLGNGGAQIREKTLDALVEAARNVAWWHEPLVKRPTLSLKAVRKLAGFVADSLLAILEVREGLDRRTAQKIAKEVHRRLATQSEEKPGAESAEQRVRALHARGELNDEVLTRAMNEGERDVIRHALALRADFPVAVVDHVLAAHSAKGITALAWKAGCPMRFATQLQLRLGGIPPAQVLNPRAGTDYPLSPEEMDWQLDFFRSLVG